MTPDETLALYKQGQQAWNAWAQAIRNKRQMLIDIGDWTDGRFDGLSGSEATRRWHAAATATFEKHRFGKEVSFKHFEFPGKVIFDGATFEGDAKFDWAVFEGEAWFEDVVVEGMSSFMGANFFNRARFDYAILKGQPVFTGATFGSKEVLSMAEFTGATFGINALFNDVTFKGAVVFRAATFELGVRFDTSTFEDRVVFNNATFEDFAGFKDVTFESEVSFNSANFEGNASFTTTFEGEAVFKGVTFKSETSFQGAIFEGNALFDLAMFYGYTAFDGAIFHEAAAFKSVRGTSVFSLAQVTFWVAPDFEQAHFDEAPRFDRVMVEPRCTFRVRWANFRRRLVDPDRDRPAHWRSLKRLAIQAHDHAREQDFFRREMIARRFVEDRPWDAVFWTGLLYQALSNFGGSLFRPLFWLSISTAAFAGLYLEAHLDAAKKHCSGLGCSVEIAAEAIVNDAAPELDCVAGPGSPLAATLNLSLRNTVLLPVLGAGESSNTIYACLYGVDSNQLQPEGQLIPPFRVRVPESVAALGMLQSLISVVLLFLLLLAIRNHFRIK